MAEEEALWDARRNALEKAGGTLLRARTTGADAELQTDTVIGATSGRIASFEVLPGTKQVLRVGTGRVLSLRIRAEVERVSIAAPDEETLERRPLVRLETVGKSRELAEEPCSKVMKHAGFEPSSDPPDYDLQIRIDIEPLLRMNDAAAPFKLQELIATARARVSFRLLVAGVEQEVAAAKAEAVARSFTSDKDASDRAISDAVTDALLELASKLDSVKQQWVREQYDGRAVSLSVAGLKTGQAGRLLDALSEVRGVASAEEAGYQGGAVCLRVQSRLPVHLLRQKLEGLEFGSSKLALAGGQGAKICCRVAGPPVQVQPPKMAKGTPKTQRALSLSRPSKPNQSIQSRLSNPSVISGKTQLSRSRDSGD
jgi:hypothetical protein